MLNAGIAWLPEKSLTPDGFEKTMGVNHLSHFHLTNLLLPKLLENEVSRVVVVASSAHAFSSAKDMMDENLSMKKWDAADVPSPWLGGAGAYGASKLANILHAEELQRRYASGGLSAYSLNPGEILTGILKPNDGWFPWLLMHGGEIANKLWPVTKSVEEGAATQVYCATKAPEGVGGFWEDSNSLHLYSASLEALRADQDKGKRFWDISNALVEGAGFAAPFSSS